MLTNEEIDEQSRQREIRGTVAYVECFLQKTGDHMIFPAYRNSLWPELVIKSTPKA